MVRHVKRTHHEAKEEAKDSESVDMTCGGQLEGKKRNSEFF